MKNCQTGAGEQLVSIGRSSWLSLGKVESTIMSSKDRRSETTWYVVTILEIRLVIILNRVVSCHLLYDGALSSSHSNVSSSKIQVVKSNHVKWIEMICEKIWLFAYNKPFDWFGRVDTTKMSISFFLLTGQQKKANRHFGCIYPAKPIERFIVSK